MPSAGERLQTFRSGGGEGRQGPYPREATADLSFECACPAGPQSLRVLRATLQEDRRVLLHRHALRDVAFKAVGVGSVGTFSAIGLLTAGDGSPLLLQIKEAQE